MSGTGAPFFTESPMAERTRSTCEPCWTSPFCANSSSDVRARITTSATSFCSRRRGIEVGEAPIDEPNAVSTAMPVFLVNWGASSWFASAKPPEVMTRTGDGVESVEGSCAQPAANATAVISSARRLRRDAEKRGCLRFDWIMAWSP